MTTRPAASFWQIWNMCFGLLGLQFGFALQTAEVSRIFQTLGASLEQIPVLWIAAPITGLLVQPIIGYCSDRTWGRFGRRRPYVLAGAILAAVSLFWMPHASALWMAASCLWLMDASINASMEPFRAFVGDRLPYRQRPLGYAMQSFFVGLGAVIATSLPWLLARFGVSNRVVHGNVPDTVRYAFYAGGAAILATVMLSVFTTGESPLPVESSPPRVVREEPPARRGERLGIGCALSGVTGAWAVAYWGLQQELYVLCGATLAYGLCRLWRRYTPGHGMLAQLLDDMHGMPGPARQLAWVQLFSWFAMFAMWLYTTAAVTTVDFGSTDTHSAAYNTGANWVGVLFAAYNGVAAVVALFLPRVARHLGVPFTHAICLWLGGAGLLAFLVIHHAHALLAAMIGIGIAWASILSLPYAMLSAHVPPAKMGVYMGIFNIFIVIPQLLAASILGLALKLFFHGRPIWALAMGGASLLLAGCCTLRVNDRAMPRPIAERAGQLVE